MHRNIMWLEAAILQIRVTLRQLLESFNCLSWDMTPYNLVEFRLLSVEPCASIFNVEYR
jgi:hypothetical protein